MADAARTLSPEQSFRFGQSRRSQIFSMALMGWLFLHNTHRLISEGWSWFPGIGAPFLGLMFALAVWQFSGHGDVATMDSHGFRFGKHNHVPWQDVTSVELRALRPDWVFPISPTRVYCMYVNAGAAKQPKGWFQHRRWRQCIKQYGTPFAFSEVLAPGSAANFQKHLKRFSDLDVIEEEGLPKEAKLLDLMSGVTALMLIGVTVGVFIGMGNPFENAPKSIISGSLLVVDVFAIAVWRQRIDRLRSSIAS